jgi:hypothetical protein
MEIPRSDLAHTTAAAASPATSISTSDSEHEDVQRPDYLDLPVRVVSDTADFREYTEETAAGEIIKPIKSNVTGQMEDWKMVTFTIDDKENPKNWSKIYKWYCTMVVAWTCFVVAFSSSVITADIEGPMEEFGISREISLLVITVFVIGFGIGKLPTVPKCLASF